MLSDSPAPGRTPGPVRDCRGETGQLQRRVTRARPAERDGRGEGDLTAVFPRLGAWRGNKLARPGPDTQYETSKHPEYFIKNVKISHHKYLSPLNKQVYPSFRLVWSCLSVRSLKFKLASRRPWPPRKDGNELINHQPGIGVWEVCLILIRAVVWKLTKTQHTKIFRIYWQKNKSLTTSTITTFSHFAKDITPTSIMDRGYRKAKPIRK